MSAAERPEPADTQPEVVELVRCSGSGEVVPQSRWRGRATLGSRTATAECHHCGRKAVPIRPLEDPSLGFSYTPHRRVIREQK